MESKLEYWADGQYARARNIIRACTDPNYPQFRCYGAKGVTVFPPWIESPKLFAEYLRTLPGWNDKKLFMVRLDDSKPYEPGNIGFIRRAHSNELTPGEYAAYMLRERTGASQRQLASMLGITRSLVQHRLNQAEAKILRTCDNGCEDTPESRDEDGKSDEQGPGG